MRIDIFRAILMSTAILLAALGGSAQDMEPIRHTLRFPDARNNYVEVESVYPTGGTPDLEVFMAVWTPGSYLVREYARNIDRVAAIDDAGVPLAVSKISKNRWRVMTGGASHVTLRYPIYCREMSVRTNFVDSSFAMLQGAATYLSLVGQNERPHQIHVELPPEWKQAVSALPAAANSDPNTFFARDYDTLVDSPIVAGNPEIFEFEVRGKKHQIVNTPASSLWDGPKSVNAARRIVEQFAAMWGEIPYDRYVFFNMLVEAGGGLEHKNSTTLMTSAWTTRSDDAFYGNPYAKPPQGGWLSLLSHEYFHVWNVKRLRPRALGPFDYEAENYTPSLWVSEGLTSYYADLALVRSGLITPEDYLARLSGAIADLQSQPGRLVQSAAESSFDAWIKGYRPDENSPNTGISYYTEGTVMGFLLDARIRAATGDQKSLDDVMRLAYQRFSGATGFTPGEFRDCIEEVAGREVAEWTEKLESDAVDFDYTMELAHFGLQFQPPASESTGSDEREKEPQGWLGVGVRVNGAGTFVSSVLRGTPAYEAGLNVEDEILAIGDRRISATFWPHLGEYFRPGDTAELLVARRGKLLRLPVTFGKEPVSSWRIEIAPDQSPAQRTSLDLWLSSR